MSVDVSKAAVDARVAKRDGAKTMQFGVLFITAVLVGIRLYTGTWLPFWWSVLFVIVALAFAAGRVERRKRS